MASIAACAGAVVGASLTAWSDPAASLPSTRMSKSKSKHTSEIHFRDPDGVMYDQWHFSQAVRTGRTLHCSGQLGLAADGSVPPEFTEEAGNAWAAVGRVLESAGFDFRDIVEYTSFHVGLQSTLPDFMRARDAVLAEPWPAWTAIGISELAVPGARVEIRVTARKRA